MIQLNLYTLVTLLSSVVIFIMGICLLVVSVTGEQELRNYRIARRFLAGAYFVLAAVGQWEVFGGIDSEGKSLVQAFTVIAASYQSMLFTFSIITLINMQYMTARRVCRNLSVITLLSGALLLVLFYLSPEVFNVAFSIALALYCFQLVYYILLFRREYRRYKHKFDNFFSGDGDRRARWIRRSFYMAACVGVVAVGSLFVSVPVYTVFTVLYTVFYIYFAVKYVNYLTLFHRIAPVVVAPVNEQETGSATEADIRKYIGEWIGQRKFLDPDVTLEMLSRELKTNHFYLSRFINSQYGQNFRSWINSHRIAESIRIMEEDRKMPMQEIAELIGIPGISTFYRQFSAVTGMTPAEYRKSISIKK